MEVTGPALLKLAESLAPRLGHALDMWMMERQQRLAASPTQPQLAGQSPAGASGPVTAHPPVQAPPPLDPATRAWLRTVYRLIEDCGDAVGAPAPSLQPDPMATATMVVDFVDRFNQFEPIVSQLVAQTPTDVIGACELIVHPQDRPAVSQLRDSPVALGWIAELQAAVKERLSEGDDDIPTTEKGDNVE
jgi:hypothetical protein